MILVRIAIIKKGIRKGKDTQIHWGDVDCVQYRCGGGVDKNLPAKFGECPSTVGEGSKSRSLRPVPIMRVITHGKARN